MSVRLICLQYYSTQIYTYVPVEVFILMCYCSVLWQFFSSGRMASHLSDNFVIYHQLTMVDSLEIMKKCFHGGMCTVCVEWD